MFKRIKNIIIIVLLFLIGGVVMNMCSGGGGTVIKTEVDTVYVHKTKLVEKYVPKVEKEYVYKTDTLYIKDSTIVGRPFTPEDTLAIVDEYFKKRIYNDTLVTEYGDVIVEDTLWQNRIHARSWRYDFRIPEVTIKKTVEFKPKPFQLYAGTSVRIGFDEWSQGVIYEPLLDPQLYLGAQYRLGNAHYLKAEVDGLRRDVVMGYAYKRNRWKAKARYSWKYNALDVGLKFYIIK